MANQANDRLIFTLLFSVILHVAVVLGISFNVFSPPENAPVNNLDITLVTQQTLTEPEEVDFLAQATNEGGGELDEKSPEPTPDLAVPLVEESPTSTPPTAELIELPAPETSPLVPPVIIPQEPEVTETKPEIADPDPVIEPETEAVAEAEPIVEPEPEPTPAAEKLTTETAEREVETSDVATDASEEIVEATEPEAPKLSAQQLMAQARSEISTLQNQLANNSKTLSEKPKKRRISASTKEYAAAAYMRAWEMKVERIGNMNYPQQAKDQNINGSLMLSVDIRPDGSVPANGIVISRSSGYAVLDEAAIKIVRMGAPYAQIPEDVLQDNDMLTIIRTWRFESLRGLSTR